MCRLDGTIRTKEERQRIIDNFTGNLSITLFLLTTQVHSLTSHPSHFSVYLMLKNWLYSVLRLATLCDMEYLTSCQILKHG